MLRAVRAGDRARIVPRDRVAQRDDLSRLPRPRNPTGSAWRIVKVLLGKTIDEVDCLIATGIRPMPKTERAECAMQANQAGDARCVALCPSPPSLAPLPGLDSLVRGVLGARCPDHADHRIHRLTRSASAMT